MSKPIILEIDNVRVGRWDAENLFIEREETYYSPIDKKDITSYRFKGYYSDLTKALQAINRKGLLIDENSAHDIKSLLKEIESIGVKLLGAKGRGK